MPSLMLSSLSSPKRSSSSSCCKTSLHQAKGSSHPEEDMIDRLAKIEYENPICADCPTRCPRWVSFLRDYDDKKKTKKEGDDAAEIPLKVEGFFCVVVCDDCAIQHHNVLSNQRCMIKCLECAHEWTHKEVDIVLGSGNHLTNRLYEADLLIDKSFIAANYEGMQASFIKQKYKKHKFRDDKLLESFLLVVHRRGIQKAKKRFLQEDKRKTWAATARRKTCAGHEIRRTNSAPVVSPIKESEEVRIPARSLGLRRSRISGSRRGSMPTLMEDHAVSDTTTAASHDQRNEVWESRGRRTTSPSSVTSSGAEESMGMLVPNNSSYRRGSGSSSSRAVSKAIGKMKASLSVSGSSSSLSKRSVGNYYDERGVPVAIDAATEETRSISSLGSFGSSTTSRRTVVLVDDHKNYHLPTTAPEETRIVSTRVGSGFESSVVEAPRRRRRRASNNNDKRKALVKCASTSALGLHDLGGHNRHKNKDFSSSGMKSVSPAILGTSRTAGQLDDAGEYRYDDSYSTDGSGSTRRSSTSSSSCTTTASGRRSVTWGGDSVLSMCSDEPAMSCRVRRPTLRRAHSLQIHRPKAGILRKTSS